MNRPAILAALLLLPGCTAVSAVTSIATMPVRAASTAVGAGATMVDATTTSQSERDEQRGRELRQQEERLGELDRDYRKHSAQCAEGNTAACARRDETWHAMQALMPGQTSRSEETVTPRRGADGR
jgi:hypothetical protein